ncbi:MAG TPA: type II CRISPR-associated endonuclease Cas1 [Bacteroidia bacterium]|nr:type II CRISPR-associated endonuclease Cas1 [Bacteroidia bacterium]
MIKRTLYFGNPSYLSLNNSQMVLRLPEVEKSDTLVSEFKKKALKTFPIEDIGVVILDHQQITLTQALMIALLENNVALISCDGTHHPSGIFLPLVGNTLQTERFREQVEASLPLKKNLWQQTVQAKIRNQASALRISGVSTDNMLYWAGAVRSGDPDNYEARAAAYYWKNIFPEELNFTRDRDGLPPNNLLNYGYAVLRAIVARGLTGSGLLPTLGIHHRNKYNAFCLADDIMEPYRPLVDRLIREMLLEVGEITELTPELKKRLLGIPVMDVWIEGERSPLMVSMQRTTASLVRCFSGESRKILYPEFR